MRQGVPKKHVIMRCPPELFHSIERICRRERLTRTRLVGMAVFHYLAKAARQGLTPPFPPAVHLPAEPQPLRPRRNYYL